MVITIRSKATRERRWVVTMGNGRTFIVFTENKAQIARDCGYLVEELRYGKPKEKTK